MAAPRFETSFRRHRSAIASRLALTVLAVFTVSISAIAAAADAPKSIELRSDWRFAKGEHEGASKPDFDDSEWSTVRVPHDWAIAGPFDPAENGYAAKLPWRGIGWYRRSFDLDCQPGQRVYLDFDGVMAFPKVYINGHLAGEWDYGYTSFRVDATPFINPHGRNVVAVRADTTKHGSRWYPGAGIYRKVTLQIRNPIHIAYGSTVITTPKISENSAEVSVRATIENHTEQSTQVGVYFTIRDSDQKVLQRFRDRVTIPATGSSPVEESRSLSDIQRWDIDHPAIYSLETEVLPVDEFQMKKIDHTRDFDRETTTFGIRDFKFTPDDGFQLNGRRLQLRGVCLHHDLGPLGTAFNTRAAERQLQIMREMGVNSIRTSHNPPALELLDLCDRMGFVVWDECFDKWDDKADRVDNEPSLERHAERHLKSLVIRDRNHPSVIIWSIANEIKEGGRNGLTRDRVAMMRDIVRKYDDTRPVGLAHHVPESGSSDVFEPLDVVGWNYSRRYANFREHYPGKPIIYSESASALSSRGFYQLPLPKTKVDYSDEHQVDSYDFNAAPWSDIPDVEFKLLREDSFVTGDFVWTGFDYLGEPTPFSQEAKNSYFGIVDLCGIPKDRYYLYRSYWRPDASTVHILPHWNWPDRADQNVPVFVYTNGDSAELLLNGRSLGYRRKDVPPQRSTNLATGHVASASSSLHDHAADQVASEQATTHWSSEPNDHAPWWQIDLGHEQPLKCLTIGFETDIKNFTYVVKVSADNKTWAVLVPKQNVTDILRGRSRDVVHDIDAHVRFLRVEFSAITKGSPVGIRTFGAYGEHVELPYYDPTYTYRLRWNNVTYEPGELKAVAYKNGQPIGTEVIRTAGTPVALRLTPDRTKLTASGEDLSFILIEAVDKDGIACPLADNMIHFDVEGPAEIAGVGNGNPLSLEPFQADHRKLFFGKAMLIVRAKEGQGGDIHVTATGDGLTSAKTTCQAAHE